MRWYTRAKVLGLKLRIRGRKPTDMANEAGSGRGIGVSWAKAHGIWK